nr:hypothetical protein [Tanacetum cinerariifolium]
MTYDESVGMNLVVVLKQLQWKQEYMVFRTIDIEELHEYDRGRENGVNILKSIDEGPFEIGTFKETLAEGEEGALHLGPERPRVYFGISSKDKERFVIAVKLNRGLKDSNYDHLYAYLKQHEAYANENKMMLDRFTQHTVDPLALMSNVSHQFAKLINDMRNIKMTMSKLQLNSKFLNNMLPEWGRFVMAVKLNRKLRDSNYDQLFAYLKQHEAHAKENKMMLERLSQPTAQPTADPLALLSNVSNTQHGSPSSSTSSFTQLPPPRANSSSPADDLIENLTSTLALLTQSYRTFFPQTNNQLRTSSNPKNQATVQDGRVVVQNVQGRPNRGQGMNPRGESAAGYEEARNRVGNAEDCDAFDSDVDEPPTAQTMFMANLSSVDPITDEARPSYDSDILSEVQDHDQYLDDTCAYHEEHVMHDSVQLDHGVDLHADYMSVSNMILYDQYVKDNEVPVIHRNASAVPNDTFMMIYNDMCEPSAPFVSNTSRNAAVKTSLTAELATYREQVELYERRAKFELTEREQRINEQLKLVISDHNFKEETLKREIHSTKLQLASTINRNKSMVEETTFLKQDFKQKENKYLANFLNMKSLKEKKMNAKMTDPECVTHKVKTATHDYSKDNLLATFTLQKQLTPEQIYWSNDLMMLKSEALKERAKGIQKALTKEVKEMKDVFEELEAEVAQCAVDRKHDAIDRKNLLIANDNLITECLSKELFSVATKSELNVARFTEMHVANTSVEARCLALEAKLATLRDKSHQENQGELIKIFPNLSFPLGKRQRYRQLKKQLSKLQVTSSDTERTVKVRTTDSQLTKVTDPVTNLQAQNDLFRAENDKVKQHYKELYDSITITCAKHIKQVTKLTAENVTLKTSVSKAKVQPPVLTRTKHVVDVEPIAPRLRNSRDAHLDYLRHLKESVETIRNIVEEAKVVRPLDRSIVSACRYTKHSQELLEYAIGTCPQGSQQRAKQLAHTHLIRKKQVTIAKPSDWQDSNKQVHVLAVKPQKTNVPVPHSTGVKSYPKASGSQPKSNPKTNRISPAKGANKLLVEDLPRTNKSHHRTTNHVDSSSRLKRTVINSNSDSNCRTCNKCLTSFDHDMCVATCVKSVVRPHFTRHNCKVEQKIKQVWKPKHVEQKMKQVWKPKPVRQV